ncbi:TonB-dependent siderophore receptor [Affinibrenneria salicis]|uniref:Ferric aerobactin receptor n=1 Tax=Affinibrenneria salicis TaxID=2590031 RepID=A0A5J5FWV1_9GAMM|nr:TonB-dependent siderophore receptor [Affinibrenneria salicis]KAA8998100.1 TonB-dependent siderophore receptor [Affinibrenneria salicis]
MLWRKNHACLTAVLIIFPPALAQAQNSADDTLVIAASRSNKTQSQMSQSTWVIEGRDIQEQAQGGKEIKDILAQLIPGMDVSSQGRTNYGMNMRGRAMVVMVDGVRLNSSRTGSRQMDAIDPFNIERIEVISGATSLYGAGSSGGLISIITKKGSPEPQVELEIGAKSGFNSHNDHDERVAAAVSGGSEQANGRLSVAWQRYGGWYTGSGDAVLFDNTQTGLQYSDRLDVMASGGLKLDENQSLTLVTQYFRSQGDGEHGLWLGDNFAAATGGGVNAETRGGMSSDRVPGTERHLVSLEYAHQDFLNQILTAQIYYRDEALTFYPFPTLRSGAVTSYSASEQNTSQYGAKLTLNADLAAGWQLTYGIDVDREKFDANQMFFDLNAASQSGGLINHEIYKIGRYPSYDVSNFAAFLQTSYDLNEIFTLSGGVRQQWTENSVDDFVGYAQQQAIANGQAVSADAIPGGSTRYRTTLFNLGLLAHISDRQQTWLNFSQGAELPDVAKYYGTGSYSAVNGHYHLNSSTNINDSRLEDIKVNAWELGWRYLGDNLHIQTAAYYSVSDKTVDIAPDLTIVMKSDKRRIYGLESAIDYFFPDSDWSAGTSFNLIKSQTKTSEGWEKININTASPSKATAWVGWQPGDWTLRLQMQKSFDVSDLNGDKLQGYHTLDFIGSYALPVGKISFSVENLLDKQYDTVWGQRAQKLYSPGYGAREVYDYQGRGRTFGLTYSAQF